MAEYLYVYGTLRPRAGHPLANRLNAWAEPLGPARYPGRLLDLGPYPGLIPDPERRHWVIGDLFRVRQPELLWPLLDRYEGCTDPGNAANEYRRERAEVRGPHDQAFEAWVYLYNRPTTGIPVIASGDYLRR